jgi:hypothetical protein
MKYLKKFDDYNAELVYAEGAPAPAPSTKPGPAPTTKPGAKPGQRPSPIRRDKPGVDPAPKAEFPKAEMDELIRKYAHLTNQKYK